MYICLHCKQLFESPSYFEDRHGLEYGPGEKIYCCPYCMSDREEYVKAHKCDICEEWIEDKYIKTDDELRFCKNCYKTMELWEEDQW